MALDLKIPREGRFRIRIVGPDGRCVRTLLREVPLLPREFSFDWDGLDDEGKKVPSEAYTPFIEEYQTGTWVPLYSPNADNHGTKAEVIALQWDPTLEKLVFSVDRPSRVRIWVVSGDDGLILARLKDMDPVAGGVIAIPWYGKDPADGNDVRSWGKIGFHYKGYALPDCALIVQSDAQESYLQARKRYPLVEAAAPRSFSDSFSLYRLRYEEQKGMKIKVTFQGTRLLVKPDPAFLECFRSREPQAKVFFKDGTWVIVSLKPHGKVKGEYAGQFMTRRPKPGETVAVVVSTNRDQHGFQVTVVPKPEQENHAESRKKGGKRGKTN